MLAARAPQSGDCGQPAGAEGVGAVLHRREMGETHRGDAGKAEDLALHLVAQG